MHTGMHTGTTDAPARLGALPLVSPYALRSIPALRVVYRDQGGDVTRAGPLHFASANDYVFAESELG